LVSSIFKLSDYPNAPHINEPAASLSAKWCYNNHRLATTLCSINSRAILDASLDAASKPLTVVDELMIAELRAKFFDPLPVCNWVNLETTRYWNWMRDKDGFEQHKG
jgi:hypothetical protein